MKITYDTDIHTGFYLEVETDKDGYSSWIRNRTNSSQIFVYGIPADAGEAEFKGFLEYSREVFYVMTRGRVMSCRKARR